MKSYCLAKSLAVLVCFACCYSAQAQPQLDPRVRTLIEQKVQDGEFPSLVIALTEGDQQSVFGFGQPGTALPDGRTVFEIGSISKTFTALLLAQAVAAGRVKLDDTPARLVPGYAALGLDGRQVTLLDLATQSSGLPRLPANLAPRTMADPYADYGRAALKAFLAGYTLTRAPGKQYEYSNLGMGLLGDLLAEQQGKPYATLVAEQISGPLGMKSTGVGASPALVGGHDAFGQAVPHWNFDALAGAGALRSNADDMLRYLQAMMAGRNAAGSPFALVQTAQRPTSMADTQIGLAWNLSQNKGTGKGEGKTLIWHNGRTGGYASFIGYTEDGQRGVVVLANVARTVDPIALSVLFPERAAKSLPLAPPPAVLAQYAGTFELAPGFVLTISPKGRILAAQATGQPAFAAFADGEDRFQLPDVGASLSFKRNAAGAVESLVLHQHGRDLPGRKTN